MIISRAKFTNFMNLRDVELVFDKEKPLSLFSGDNGEGKTTFFIGVAYLTTGKVYGERLSDYISWGENNFALEMDMTHEGKEYKFDYSFKASKKDPNKGTSNNKITIDGERVLEGVECTKALSEIFDFDLLEDAIYSIQSGADVVNKKPTALFEMFKDLFKVDFSDFAIELEQEMYHEAIKKSEELKIKKEALGMKVYEDPTDIEIKDDMVFTDSEKGQLEAIKAELTDISTNIAIADDRKKQREVATFKVSQVEKEIELLKSKIVEDERNLSDFQLSFDKEITLLRERVGGITLTRKPLPLGEKSFEIDKYITEIATLKQSVKGFESVTELSTQRICPTCYQPTANIDFRAINSEIAEMQSKITSAMESLEKEKESKKAYEDQVAEINRQIQSHELLEKELDSLNTLIAEKRSSFERNLSIYENTLKERQDSLSSKMIEYAESQATLRGIPVTNDEDLKEDFDSVKGKIAQLESKKSFHERALVVNEENEKTRKRNEELRAKDAEFLAEVNTEINDLILLESDYRTAIDVLKRKLGEHIIKKRCNVLKSKINSFIRSTGYGKPLMVDIQLKGRGLSVQYTSDGINYTTVKLASGFENALLNLAFKVTFAKYYNVGLLILDEVDGKATDKNSIGVYDIISELKDFNQIFVISHKEAVKELLSAKECSEVYTVKDGNISRV